MKILKVLFLACSVVLMAVSFSACGGANDGSSIAEDANALSAQPSSIQPSEAKAVVRAGVLRGPTGLGLVELMEKASQKEARNYYEFTLAGAPDEISGKIINGDLDVACVPTNLASTLYNKTEGKVKIIAVNTLGVLYMLQNNAEEAIASIEDLAGKTIYSSGQGATQEYVLNYLLESSGVEDATVKFKAEHAELASLVLAGSAEYALLPQPFVTSVTTKEDGVRVALDITEQWEKATQGKQLAMGCVIVREEFLEKNQAAVNLFLEELASSVNFANQNIDECAAFAGKHEIIDEAVAKKAIPQCNIVCVTGNEMKASVSAYLEVLQGADPKSIGGNLPDDAFYYLP